MYFDSKTNRVLLRNGKSLTSDWKFATDVLNGIVPDYNVARSKASEKYDFYYGKQITEDIEEVHLL